MAKLLTNRSLSTIFISGGIFCWALACTPSEKERVETDSHFEPKIRIVVESLRDTVVNGEIYSAKVFLNSDSLYTRAMENDIENYLMVKYAPAADTTKFSPASHIAKLYGDTAYISFAVHDDPSHFSTSGLRPHIWQVDFSINYLNDLYDPDTTFIQLFKFFVQDKPAEK